MKLTDLFKQSAIDRQTTRADNEMFALMVRKHLKPEYRNDRQAIVNFAFTMFPILKTNDLK